MPELLNPELLALRDRCTTFANEHMLPLGDLDHSDAAAKETMILTQRPVRRG